MGFKEHMRVGRRTSPDAISAPPVLPQDFKTATVFADKRGRSAQKDDIALMNHSVANDPDLVSKQPKRSSSFGRGLGGLQSLASGMSRASESLSRKTNHVDGTGTPSLPSTTPGAMGPPSLPDSSHLAQYSLKLSELVNKAFFPCTPAGSSANPASGGMGASSSLAVAAKSAAAKTSGTGTPNAPALTTIAYEGKKLPSKPIISEIAMTVVTELEYASSVDPYLLRAVSRQSLKALTMFADRIDSLLVTPSKDPSALFIPSTAKEGTHLPPALEFNLGLISLEWIVEDALERCIEGPSDSVDEGMPHFVSEILTPVRKKMETTILHVVQPLLANSKVSLHSTLSKSVLTPFAGFGQNLSPISSANNGIAPGLVSPGVGTSSPSITPSSAWLKELEGKVEAIRRLLVPRLAERCGQDGEGWFISIVIHTIWKGLLILTSKSMPLPSLVVSKYSTSLILNPLQTFAAEANKRAPSPAQITSALKAVSVVGRARKGPENVGTPSGTSTPSNAAMSMNTTGNAIHAGGKATAAQIADLQAFEKLMLRFAAGFGVRKSDGKNGTGTFHVADDSSDSDSDEDDEDELARAALAEALQAIRSTILVGQYLDVYPEAILDATKSKRGRSNQNNNSSSLPSEVVHAAKAIPNLLLLHLVYARMPTHLGVFIIQKQKDGSTEAIVPSPPAAFGYTWNDYERAIAGFAGGQSWTKALVEAWRQDLQEAEVDIKEREGSIKKQIDEIRCKIKSHLDPTSAAKSKPIGILSEGSTVIDAETEATPTPQSVLMQQRSTSPATSVGGRSSDSLPDTMTKSAPDLMRQEPSTSIKTEEQKISLSRTSSTSKKSASPKLTSTVQQQQNAATPHKERPTWSFIRQASRKVRSVSGSETSSPQKTPEASPPQTPSMNALRPLGDLGQIETNQKTTLPSSTNTTASAPASRGFWRSTSSQGKSTSASNNGMTNFTSTGFHLPTLNSLRANGSSRETGCTHSDGSQCSPTSELERMQEEIKLETECIRLLSHALDSVNGAA